MPGMSSGLNANNPIIAAAFKAALVRDGLILLLVCCLLGLAGLWLQVARARLTRAGASPAPESASAQLSVPLTTWTEPPARRFLRVGFGLLWVVDGLLQAQPQMPLGMTSGVIEPAASSSPGWVQHLVNAGATIWSYHPIAAPASAVWIQIGIGLLLLVGPRGRWSRMGGVASALWGLLVWVFGEAFGGIFAPGSTWLFGTPGAVLFYVVAGVLVAMPESWWSTERLGRSVLDVMGLFFVGMAILQAWPSGGFWQGRLLRGRQPDGTRLGPLSDMVHQMAATPQPHVLSSWLSSFEAFDAAHGFAVNLFLVLALAAVGLGLLANDRRIVAGATAGGFVLCLADWVLVQDLGVLGGVGTDPNSMIPMALLVASGALALSRLPAAVPAVTMAGRDAPLGPLPVVVRPTGATVLPAATAAGGRWRVFVDHLAQRPPLLARTLAAFGAVAVIVVGAAPMAVASVNPNASSLIAQATDGVPNVNDFAAPKFHLVDQYGAPVSLGSLRGKVLVLTFLDPVCNTDCPIIAQELREANTLLGPAAAKVDFVAVVANPLYRARSYPLAFDRQEHLSQMRNWLFLTGGSRDLAWVWRQFGVQVQYSPGGAMVAHSEVAYVIDGSGRIRAALDNNPGPGSAASKSSFAVMVDAQVRRVMGRS